MYLSDTLFLVLTLRRFNSKDICTALFMPITEDYDGRDAADYYSLHSTIDSKLTQTYIITRKWRENINFTFLRITYVIV